jgi:hypothetical protein
MMLNNNHRSAGYVRTGYHSVDMISQSSSQTLLGVFGKKW